MARGLYRFYLYAISSALLIFVVIATDPLLAMLLAYTPLQGIYSGPPTRSALVQALVFALVSWLIAGTLGGLHYWLIRRDMRNDPAAGTSAIRAFFLNITETVGVLIAVGMIGFGAIDNRAHNPNTDVTWAVATGLLTLAAVLLLELERRRVPAQKGAALIFQRLHLFGTQAILLFFFTGAFLNNFRFLIKELFFSNTNLCVDSYCPTYNSGGLALTLFWFAICWLAYGLATSRDTSRNVRMVMHGASLAFGTGYGLFGVFTGLDLLLSPLFKISVQLRDVLGFSAPYDFFSPLLLGLLITTAYSLLLHDVSRRGLIEARVRELIEWAIAAVLMAILFWSGIGYALYNLVQTLAPTPLVPDGESWAATLALVISGVGYIPLGLYIRHCKILNPAAATWTRRGFVLLLLSAGVLALVIGSAIALYAWGTSLLGSPISNWPQTAHVGLAIAIVGAIVTGIYLWSAQKEQLLTRHARTDEPPTPAPPVPAGPETLEKILDELLAGHISREEAATRIRALESFSVALPG
ncbi:MAG TPA: hypothetical protein VFV38_41345 [Ktedonobacteraceae bacterium]|nr:hypothetical protein [Ktedonobacteraceae bacterium]